MKETVVNAIIGVIVFITALFIQNDDTKATLMKISVGLLLAVLVKLAVLTWSNWKRIKVVLQSYLNQPKTPVRVSMAYLFRIVIDGKYMLVKNHRGQPGYQPVGGVYKFLRDENASFFDEIGLLPDDKMPVDVQSKDDLRGELTERWRLNAFLKWFETKKNRETDPWREFYEELIADGLIDAAEFPFIQYNLCKSHFTKIHRSPKWSIDEFLYADIYELKWDNQKQKAVFEELALKENDLYVFATPDEIRKGYTATGKVILPHAKKLLV